MFGWLRTCWGAVVVVAPIGAGTPKVVVVDGAVDVVVEGPDVVVAGGRVVGVGWLVVVVVDGPGATVVVVAAPAAAPPTTPSRGPHTMTAMPVRAIAFG
jgi:predicted ribosome-associated RNA-binding protein Tma20